MSGVPTVVVYRLNRWVGIAVVVCLLIYGALLLVLLRVLK